MKRAVPAVITTVIGLIALASFKSAPGVVTKSASAQSVKPTTPVATAPPSTTPTTSASAGTTPSTRTAPTTTPPTTPPTTSANAVRTFDGQAVDNQYGAVQVRVTMQGSQISDVTALQMPFDHQRSAEISQQAAPLLRQETLQAQSALDQARA